LLDGAAGIRHVVGRHVRDLARGPRPARTIWPLLFGELARVVRSCSNSAVWRLNCAAMSSIFARHVDDVGREGARLLGDAGDQRLGGVLGHGYLSGACRFRQPENPSVPETGKSSLNPRYRTGYPNGRPGAITPL